MGDSIACSAAQPQLMSKEGSGAPYIDLDEPKRLQPARGFKGESAKDRTDSITGLIATTTNL
jgi:hypothetical protein